MSPLRRRRIWWQAVPVLLCGAAVVALLPANHPSVNHIDPAPGTGAVETHAAETQPATTQAGGRADNGRTTAPGIETASLEVPDIGKASVTPVAAVTNAAVGNSNPGPSGTSNDLPSTADLSAPPADAPKLPDGVIDGSIGASAVNVRSGPSVDSDKRFVAQPGEAVKIGESNGNWVHVYRADGTDGWVYGRYIAGHEPSPDVAPPATAANLSQPRRSAPAADDSRDAGNLIGRFGEAHGLITARVGPNGGARPAFLLQPGDRFRISQAHGSWILIVTDDGMSGWIAT